MHHPRRTTRARISSGCKAREAEKELANNLYLVVYTYLINLSVLRKYLALCGRAVPLSGKHKKRYECKKCTTNATEKWTPKNQDAKKCKKCRKMQKNANPFL